MTPQPDGSNSMIGRPEQCPECYVMVVPGAAHGCSLWGGRNEVDLRNQAVDLIYRRLDGGGSGTTSKDCIKAVLHAAEQEFDAVFGPDLIVCLDCQGRAIPLCDVSGHGLVTLADLMESYSNA